VPARGSRTFSSLVLEDGLVVLLLEPAHYTLWSPGCLLALLPALLSLLSHLFPAAEKSIFVAEQLLHLGRHIAKISLAQSSRASASIPPSRIRFSTTHRRPGRNKSCRRRVVTQIAAGRNPQFTNTVNVSGRFHPGEPHFHHPICHISSNLPFPTPPVVEFDVVTVSNRRRRGWILVGREGCTRALKMAARPRLSAAHHARLRTSRHPTFRLIKMTLATKLLVFSIPSQPHLQPPTPHPHNRPQRDFSAGSKDANPSQKILTLPRRPLRNRGSG